MAIFMAVGAVVSWVIVFAHSNSTDEDLELESMKIAFMRRYFWLGSILQSLRSISSTMSWNTSPISCTGSSVVSMPFRYDRAFSYAKWNNKKKALRLVERSVSLIKRDSIWSMQSSIRSVPVLEKIE